MAQTYYSKSKVNINNGEFKVYVAWIAGASESSMLSSAFANITDYTSLDGVLTLVSAVEFGKMQNDAGFSTAVGQTVDDNYGHTVTLDRKFTLEATHIGVNKAIKKHLISKDGNSCHVILVNGGENGGTAILTPFLIYNNDFESNSADMKKAIFNLSKDVPDGEMIGIVKKFTANS